MDYRQSGVDTELADQFVDRIKKLVGKTYDARTVSAVGGFAALYKMDDERFLASSTDGVGTKLKLAIETDTHHTIGIDLVAMCVNDLLCTGAKPLFFLDYFATGKLSLHVGEKVLEGIVEGCLQSGMALLGGETAEMPGMYSSGDYDLAGFSVGEVYRQQLIDGSRLLAGDALIGIASSGFHSNGFSLIRKLIEIENDAAKKLEMKKACLIPTRIYVKTISHLQTELGPSLRGLAHITGSGLLNIPRINANFDYHVETWPEQKELPNFMQEILSRSGLSDLELYRTFNMGVGMVIATDQPDKCLSLLKDLGEKAWLVGKVTPGTGEIFVHKQKL